jgi:hypothetical protein
MSRRKPYAPRLSDQIAVRTTRSILYLYYDLYLRLRRTGQLNVFRKNLTKEAMINALLLACSEIESERLIRWLKKHVVEFERRTRTNKEDEDSGLDTSHLARRSAQKPRVTRSQGTGSKSTRPSTLREPVAGGREFADVEPSDADMDPEGET